MRHIGDIDGAQDRFAAGNGVACGIDQADNMENRPLSQHGQHCLDIGRNMQVFFVVGFKEQQSRVDAGEAARHILFKGAAVYFIFSLRISQSFYPIDLYPIKNSKTYGET